MVILPFTPCPATGDAFLGRQGLVRNLRGRIARGESLAVIGGPKLGKTSLVRTALHGLDHTVIEIDCGAESSPRIDVVPGSIVVLENLDSFADSAIESLLARVSAAKPTGIIVTGGRRLRAILGHSGTLAVSFRVFPLSVLLDGETRRLIGRDMSAGLAAWTGNHPYLTKLLLHYMDGERDENHRTLNPTLAQSETGIRDVKGVADMLVYMGVISRWIRNEEATLFAGCRLLNDFITAKSKAHA